MRMQLRLTAGNILSWNMNKQLELRRPAELNYVKGLDYSRS